MSGESRHRRSPQRRCVACHRSEAKEGLWRIVVDRGSGQVSWDEEGRALGRGAYVHPRFACVRGIADGTRLLRSLRAGAEGKENASPIDRTGVRLVIEKMFETLQRLRVEG